MLSTPAPCSRWKISQGTKTNFFRARQVERKRSSFANVTAVGAAPAPKIYIRYNKESHPSHDTTSYSDTFLYSNSPTVGRLPRRNIPRYHVGIPTCPPKFRQGTITILYLSTDCPQALTRICLRLHSYAPKTSTPLRPNARSPRQLSEPSLAS